MIYSILDYGAVPDGRTNCAPAIQAAVDAAAGAGGGTVLVPSGRYYSAPSC
jgi:polygalacturonase